MSKTNGDARSVARGPRHKTQASSPSDVKKARPGNLHVSKMMDGRVERGQDVGANGTGGLPTAAEDLLRFANNRRFATILADPPWRFTNRTGKMAPEHRRLSPLRDA